MKKRKKLPNQEKKTSGPGWQKGEYSRHAEFDFILPRQFLMVCKLMEVTPREVIGDFIDNLSCGTWNREGRDHAKAKLIEYFVAHGYGQQYYSEEDIRIIFKEMDAMGSVWPNNSKIKLVNLTVRWRKKYQTYWFKQWHGKPRRKIVNVHPNAA